MIELNARQFYRLYWTGFGFALLIVLLRCIYVPMAHDEVANFNFYIQQGSFIPFLSHVDAMGHFLLNATAWFSFKLFGSSAFALRLPSLLSFIVLGVAVFKFNNLFNGAVPKTVLSFAFIFAYNFIAFFALSRGYAISMAFLVLALFYFFCYLKHTSLRYLARFILFSQLALSANLTLVFVLLIITGISIVIQFRANVFFNTANMLLLLLHLGLIGFWVKYGFFLQHSGALYYGGGSNYWQVTFLSLIETILFKSPLACVLVVCLFIIMCLRFIIGFYKQGRGFLLRSNFAISFFCLCSLIISFFLLKKLLGINYPEDRTGLFFYVFFILSLSFMVNETHGTLQFVYLLLPLFFALHFVLSVNLRVHPWRIYETIPTAFYEKLVHEQKLNTLPITVGGHRMREFIYGFQNYNSDVKLNYMTAPEALQMNCDYAVAYVQDKPWYSKFYSELAVENDWGFRLIKRKIPLQKELLAHANNIPAFTGSGEYYNVFEKNDTTFGSVNPLQAEFCLSVAKASVPLNAWLVVQLDAEANNGTSVFVRVPLNMIKYNWNGTSRFTTCLVTGNIPLKIKRLVCYLWNIDKKEINIKIHSFRLLRLNGSGVTEISKAKF